MKTEKLIQEYEINAHTMIIVPKGLTHSNVYELDEEYLTPSVPLEIVKKGCQYFGCSFEGRRSGTKELINISIKAPIIVDPHTPIYLLPTSSPLKPQCIWINPVHVISHEKNDSQSIFITFRNNKTYEVPISFASFDNQLSRAARLRIKYSDNIKRMENQIKSTTKTFYFKAAEQQRKYDSKG
ncbi:competence protein ComK [Lederbergia lenta]|uniref:Competence transcription factor (CTF) n=1 Tax=Lederbergia lenta TaxID=1467 RepID=A0A2X4WMS7_LEDLE|nr:competence protein ComK [Lederbergia lenta]MCM3110487.1 competence protein ComK [Lederbergia lenta]MEC2323947.1 competence protein ComK [Lederbergia lenta]SQI60978.1 competence transcription factor (CTF) [Lederbergia lenta]